MDNSQSHPTQPQQLQPEISTLPPDSGSAGDTASSVSSPDLDDLLDDIEDMVADDAQNFVQGFVQKGGE